jgi:hypothetical protein
MGSKRGRPPLEGGRVEVSTGMGSVLLGKIKAAARDAGMQRAAWIRAACEKALREGLEASPSDAGSVDHTGPVLARGASAMARGRWAGWFPCDLSTREIVADLRRHVPDGWVVLRRPRWGPVFAEIVPPLTAQRRELETRAPRFHRVIPPTVELEQLEHVDA